VTLSSSFRLHLPQHVWLQDGRTNPRSPPRGSGRQFPPISSERTHARTQRQAPSPTWRRAWRSAGPLWLGVLAALAAAPVTRAMSARGVVCAAAALSGLTHTDGCELSFALRGKRDPETGRRRSLRSHHPGALGLPGPPGCGDRGGCCFPPASPTPESLGGPP